jgi:hypothetical protein
MAMKTMTMTALPWESLAGITGTGDCTCTDAQLALVGCDCRAQQNLPVHCHHCDRFLRSQHEIQALLCTSCTSDAATGWL